MAVYLIRSKATAMAMVMTMLVAGMWARDIIYDGESINTGEFLKNGPYRFIMQTDCNLVLYANTTRTLWSTGTNGVGTSCKATLQDNGDFVIFSGSDVVWSSASARGPNDYRLQVQSDGNVVIYGAALWSTNTKQSKRRLV